MAVLAAVMGAAACGGDGDNDKQAIEDVIRAQEAAWNDQDFDAYKATQTEAGLKESLSDAEDPDTEAGLREAFGLFTEDRQVVHKIGDIKVDGDKATAYVEIYQEAREDPAFATILIGLNGSFVKEGDDWKIDAGIEIVSPEKPDGVTSVHIDANEFAFAFNADDITSGNVAFEIANVGKQPHHFLLQQIPADLDIEAALQSDEDPESVQIGGTPPWDPGETFDIVFTAELEPGRYVMMCFMPDTDDPEETPHAYKGMWKDFTIK